MAFPFLALARSHHLTGRPGPLTENFSASGSSLSLSLSVSLLIPVPSFSPSLSLFLFLAVSVRARNREQVAVFFESSASPRYPVRGFIFQGPSLR